MKWGLSPLLQTRRWSVRLHVLPKTSPVVIAEPGNEHSSPNSLFTQFINFVPVSLHFFLSIYNSACLLWDKKVNGPDFSLFCSYILHQMALQGPPRVIVYFSTLTLDSTDKGRNVLIPFWHQASRMIQLCFCHHQTPAQSHPQPGQPRLGVNPQTREEKDHWFQVSEDVLLSIWLMIVFYWLCQLE